MWKSSFLVIGIWTCLLILVSVASACPPFNTSQLGDFTLVKEVNSSTVEIRCTSGLLFHTEGSNYTQPSVTPIYAHCQATGKWSVDSVACWKGLFVNVASIKEQSLSLKTGVATVFLCPNADPRKYSEVVLHLGHLKVQRPLLAWTNATLSWRQDGIPVRCEYVSKKSSVATAWKILKLQYDSGFGKIHHSYSFKIGSTDILELPVHSKLGNLQDSDVRIFKGDKEVKNFFVTHHKKHVQFIILPFKNFQSTDAGNYTIVLSHSGDQQVTERIVIFAESQFQSPAAVTAGVAVGCVLLLTLIVVGIACGVKKCRRAKRGGSESNDDVFLPSRSGIRHMLIVDDADDGRNSTASSSASGDQRPADGWRRPIELVETRASMEDVDFEGVREDIPGTSLVQ